MRASWVARGPRDQPAEPSVSWRKLTIIGQTFHQVAPRVRHGALTRHLAPVRQTPLPVRQAEALRWSHQTAPGLCAMLRFIGRS